MTYSFFDAYFLLNSSSQTLALLALLFYFGYWLYV